MGKKNHCYVEKTGKIAKKTNFYQTFVPQNHCCDSVPKMKGHIKICTILNSFLMDN